MKKFLNKLLYISPLIPIVGILVCIWAFFDKRIGDDDLIVADPTWALSMGIIQFSTGMVIWLNWFYD